MSVANVTFAIGTFYNASASGLDGLCPQHLKGLTSLSTGNNGPRLLNSLTNLCNFLLKGMLNPMVCPFLYGGALCALTKKDGSVRPIAVGNTLGRLVAKLCCHAVKEDMSSYLQPRQLRFGTRLGCEAAIHATRLFAMDQNNDSVSVIAKRHNYIQDTRPGAYLRYILSFTNITLHRLTFFLPSTR